MHALTLSCRLLTAVSIFHVCIIELGGTDPDHFFYAKPTLNPHVESGELSRILEHQKSKPPLLPARKLGPDDFDLSSSDDEAAASSPVMKAKKSRHVLGLPTPPTTVGKEQQKMQCQGAATCSDRGISRSNRLSASLHSPNAPKKPRPDVSTCKCCNYWLSALSRSIAQCQPPQRIIMASFLTVPR